MINKIKSFFFRYRTRSAKAVANGIDEKSVRDSYKQRLYEKWVCKETWLLRAEGIPLLLGQTPGSDSVKDDEPDDNGEALWKHARECAEKNILPVVNRECHPDEWRVKSVVLYKWAVTTGVRLPDEFSLLMNFVLRTVKTDDDFPSVSDVGTDGR